jgi:hypothetical protein
MATRTTEQILTFRYKGKDLKFHEDDVRGARGMVRLKAKREGLVLDQKEVDKRAVKILIDLGL